MLTLCCGAGRSIRILPTPSPSPSAFLGSAGNCAVEEASLLPQTKLSDANPLGDIFARAADDGEFEVMNHARAIHRHMSEQAAFHQVQ